MTVKRLAAKRCSRCREVKDHSEFYRNRSSRDGLQAPCKGCFRQRQRERARSVDPPEVKTCSKCGTARLAVAFYGDASRRDGLSAWCKDCGNDSRTRRRARDRGWRKYQLLKHGLSENDYERMVGEQGGVCAICSSPPTDVRCPDDPRLQVDHCHETGAVRGLLCGSCNRGLGLLKDDPVVLRAAAVYLEGAP